MYISCDSLNQYHNCQCLLSVSIFSLRSPSLPRFKTQAPLIVVKRGKIPNVMNAVDPVWPMGNWGPWQGCCFFEDSKPKNARKRGYPSVNLVSSFFARHG